MITPRAIHRAAEILTSFAFWVVIAWAMLLSVFGHYDRATYFLAIAILVRMEARQ